MRDYKGHSSRTPPGEASPGQDPARPPPAPRTPVGMPPRTSRPPVDAPDEPPEEPTPRRRTYPWLWLLVFLLLVLSAGIWWWLASLPISNGQLGLLHPNAGSATTSATSGSTASSGPAQTAHPNTAPVQSTAPQAVAGPAATPAATPAPTALALSSGPAPAVVATVSATPSARTASTQSNVHFNFYQILPKMKVDIPADILGSGPGIPSSIAATLSAGGSADTPVHIQVGAFSNLSGAKVIQDRLALMGIPSHLLPLTGEDGETYYRVRTGTYLSSNAAQSALGKIRGLGITPILQQDLPPLKTPAAPSRRGSGSPAPASAPVAPPAAPASSG